VTETPQDKQVVKGFWNRNMNQVSFLKTPEVGSRAFFEESDSLRYQYHFYLLPLFNELSQRYPGGRLFATGARMSWEAPLPQDMRDLLQSLREDTHGHV
jgi:hypothetical protein